MGWIILAIVIVVIIALVLWAVGAYNALVALRNRVKNGWAQIDVQLKQRADLIPNLVETVKGYAGHESSVLTQVTQARAGAAAAAANPNATTVERATAENALSRALFNLQATMEAYPQLQANQNFMDLQAQLKDLERDNEILAYVDENYTQAQAKALQSRLEAVDNVASATFITKEQAMEDFIAKYPDEDYFQDLDPSILRDRYAIKVKDLTRQSQTVTQIKAVAGIAKVNAYEELAGGFITIRNIATVICVALIAVLFVVSVFIISNTIKLTTFDRKDEIAIMKMVGATNGFIRWPFVYEGFMLGLTGAVLAFLLQWGLYEAIAKGVGESDTLQLISVVPFAQLWQPVAGVFLAAGILIGVGGSLSAIRRFLQV